MVEQLARNLQQNTVINLRLATDLEANTTLGSLGVVDSLSTCLNVTAYTVVVAGRECVEVVQGVDSDGVLWGVVANSGSVLGKLALGDVVRCLSTNEETITTNDAVSGESRALNETR